MNESCISSHSNDGYCVQPLQLDEDQIYLMMFYSWWVEGIGSVVVASSGILLNIAIIVVTLRSELAAFFFNWLLLCLAIFDNLHLLNGILEAFRKYFFSSQLHDYFFVYFLHYFRGVIMCCSEYMIVLLALERYHA